MAHIFHSSPIKPAKAARQEHVVYKEPVEWQRRRKNANLFCLLTWFWNSSAAFMANLDKAVPLYQSQQVPSLCFIQTGFGRNSSWICLLHVLLSYIWSRGAENFICLLGFISHLQVNHLQIVSRAVKNPHLSFSPGWSHLLSEPEQRLLLHGSNVII